MFLQHGLDRLPAVRGLAKLHLLESPRQDEHQPLAQDGVIVSKEDLHGER